MRVRFYFHFCLTINVKFVDIKVNISNSQGLSKCCLTKKKTYIFNAERYRSISGEDLKKKKIIQCFHIHLCTKILTIIFYSNNHFFTGKNFPVTIFKLYEISYIYRVFIYVCIYYVNMFIKKFYTRIM